MAKNILVIGDTIIDDSIFTDALGLSLESPTLKTELTSREIEYGGAANVVKNIIHLGSECTFVTSGEVKLPKVSLINLQGTPARKLRVWVRRGDSDYKYIQVNENSFGAIDDFEDWKLIDEHDLVVLCDYGHGVLNDQLIKIIIQECKKRNVPVYSSSQISDSFVDYSVFNGSEYIVLNSKEFNEQFDSISSKVIVTEGENGCSVFYNGKRSYEVPPFSVDVVDTTGAGDCFLAAFCSSEMDEISALMFANQYAAKSTLVKGTGLYEE